MANIRQDLNPGNVLYHTTVAPPQCHHHSSTTTTQKHGRELSKDKLYNSVCRKLLSVDNISKSVSRRRKSFFQFSNFVTATAAANLFCSCFFWNACAKFGMDEGALTQVPAHRQIFLCFSFSHSVCTPHQCDQIGQFIGLDATFQSLWQHLVCPNLTHSEAIFIEVSKSLSFYNEIMFGQLL